MFDFKLKKLAFGGLFHVSSRPSEVAARRPGRAGARQRKARIGTVSNRFLPIFEDVVWRVRRKGFTSAIATAAASQ